MPYETNGKFILLGVTFENYSKVYHYLTEDETVEPYDIVAVPVGCNGEKKQAVVTEVLLCTKNDSPYPVEKLKKIIKKIDCNRAPATEKILQKCLDKPVKLIFNDFKTLSGILRFTLTAGDEIYLKIANLSGNTTVPSGAIKYVVY